MYDHREQRSEDMLSRERRACASHTQHRRPFLSFSALFVLCNSTNTQPTIRRPPSGGKHQTHGARSLYPAIKPFALPLLNSNKKHTAPGGDACGVCKSKSGLKRGATQTQPLAKQISETNPDFSRPVRLGGAWAYTKFCYRHKIMPLRPPASSPASYPNANNTHLVMGPLLLVKSL